MPVTNPARRLVWDRSQGCCAECGKKVIKKVPYGAIHPPIRAKCRIFRVLAACWKCDEDLTLLVPILTNIEKPLDEEGAEIANPPMDYWGQPMGPIFEHLKQHNTSPVNLVEHRPRYAKTWDGLKKVPYLFVNMCPRCNAVQGWSELINGFDSTEGMIKSGKFGDEVEVLPKVIDEFGIVQNFRILKYPRYQKLVPETLHLWKKDKNPKNCHPSNLELLCDQCYRKRRLELGYNIPKAKIESEQPSFKLYR
jgi:hypothetical protein